MNINKLDIDKTLKTKLNLMLEEFEYSKVSGNIGKPKSFFDKIFS